MWESVDSHIGLLTRRMLIQTRASLALLLLPCRPDEILLDTEQVSLYSCRSESTGLANAALKA